jgi:hypothetical protein
MIQQNVAAYGTNENDLNVLEKSKDHVARLTMSIRSADNHRSIDYELHIFETDAAIPQRHITLSRIPIKPASACKQSF